MAVEDAEDTIKLEGTHSYCLSLEPLSDAKAAIAEVHPAGSIDLADCVANIVLNRRQLFWKQSRAGLIPGDKRQHVQGFVGALLVADRSPDVKRLLTVIQGLK